jgi:hypothetical protein
MNVSLTPELEAFVRRKVATGLYGNASEVVRQALRVLLELDGRQQAGKPQRPPQKDRICADLRRLEAPLRERGIVSLALFGSVLRDEARNDSEVDLLIGVSPAAKFSLVDLVSIKNFLEEQIGCEVDLVTKDGLDPVVRESVLQEAERVF